MEKPPVYSGKKVALELVDGSSIVLEEEIAKMSGFIKNVISDSDIKEDEFAMPVPNVTNKIFTKIVEYCKYHYENDKPPEPVDEYTQYIYSKKDEKKNPTDIQPWDKQFFSNYTALEVFEVMIAADFLELKELSQLCAKTIANILMGKRPEEIRKILNIVNDFTPEEEEENMKIYKHFDV